MRVSEIIDLRRKVAPNLVFLAKFTRGGSHALRQVRFSKFEAPRSKLRGMCSLLRFN